jgi:hypothetical protein
VLGSWLGAVVVKDAGTVPAIEDDVLLGGSADSGAITRSDGSLRREGIPVAVTPTTIATTINTPYVSARERIGARA